MTDKERETERSMFVNKRAEQRMPGILWCSVIGSEGSVCSNYRNRVCDYIKNRETI